MTAPAICPLGSQIAKLIRERVERGVQAHRSPTAEWRMVFHGPPPEFLDPVFDVLSTEGGIAVDLGEEAVVRVPVLLQSELLQGADPAIGQSGRCSAEHLLNLRNSPSCPKFVALIPPGKHTNLSFASASGEFGVSAASNTGNAEITDWWNDDFVQLLVEHALSRLLAMSLDTDREEARTLIGAAVRAADEGERHDVSRRGAWRVLARVYAIAGNVQPGAWLSLACGFPPTDDGSLAADDQAGILAKLASYLEEHGIAHGLELLKEDATEADGVALDAFSAHLQGTCDLLTAMARAASFYYAPCRSSGLQVPPDWWGHLTLEKWTELLEEEHKPAGALRLECVNRIFPPFRGGHSVVQAEARLAVSVPEDTEGVVDARLTRLVSGKSNTTEWALQVSGTAEQVDSALPVHRAPARYVGTAPGLKKATIKVISLATWEPGFFVYCANARKTSPPRRPRGKSAVNLECTLALEGNGRHYVMIYCRPGIEFDPVGRREDDAGDDAGRDVTIVRVDEKEWGFEAEVAGECQYDLKVREKGGEWATVRIYLTSEDAMVQGCRTEFDRLIRLNRQGAGDRGTTEVQLDRNVRCADLQGWILAPDNVERSFYPLVMASDYALNWGPPAWVSRADSILSKARFLHDPRPDTQDFNPPEDFRKSRKAIAGRITGSDGHGLTESAPLGQWLAEDEGFAELLHQYLHAYQSWLDADPDVAPWADVILVCGMEQDRSTLRQEPDAVILSPLHPVRLVWQALAQRVLFQAYKRHKPCPAASILDPDSVPDALSLPLRTAAGATARHSFFSLDCSSDYWSVLWNAKRLDSLAATAGQPPLNDEFGIRVGGISSGFSGAQVRRSLDDVAEMLSAKPVLSVMVSSSSGHTNACNEGITDWCKARLGPPGDAALDRLGPRTMQILDLRDIDGRPQDAEISNLAEDTANAVKWYAASKAQVLERVSADLGIIAQLEISNPHEEPADVASPLGWGGLLRHRVRRQLASGAGSFLAETRVGAARGPTGDVLADKLSSTVAKLEGAGGYRAGFTFAPSVHAITEIIDRCDFAAVSSSAVDPACFLGKWLPGFLWDYDLPSYSQRAGDTNGYYLISKIKPTDRDALGATLANLPGGDKLAPTTIDAMILEVARRGIPTVRGLSSGSSGAAGDLGMFVASRLLQDAFRVETSESGGLLPVLHVDADVTTIALIIPVDPFRGYIEDLQRMAGDQRWLRPDLLVAGIRLTDSGCWIRMSPLEVKFRTDSMNLAAAKEALGQAQALSRLFGTLEGLARDPELIVWRLTLHHLLGSMLGFGFRVYSQQRLVGNQSKHWTEIHARVVAALFSEEACVEYDRRGRLLILDKAGISGPRDIDEDSFHESLSLSAADAASVLFTEKPEIYNLIRARVGDWSLLPPIPVTTAPAPEQPAPSPANGAPEVATHAAGGLASIPRGDQPSETSTVSPSLPDVASTPASSATSEGVRFQVGSTIDGFRNEPRYFYPSDTNLNQLNIGVVGDLGTGKTQLLKGLLWRIAGCAASNRGITPRVLIFDYKRDYSDPDFVAAVGARIVKPHRLPVNVFDLRYSPESLTPWLDRFNFFSDILDKVYSGIGPIQRRQLKAAVKRAYEEAKGSGRQPTIYDVSSIYAEMLDGKADSPSSILEDMVDRELFHPEPEKAEAFASFLDGIVVVDLAALGQDDRAKNMLVAIMLNLFYEQMLRTPKRPFEGTDPQLRALDSFLLVDEADNIMRYEFDVLRKVLLQGREFGVGVILASQYLRHFKTGATDYREPLLTWFIHKVPNITATELQALGMTMDVAEMAERIKGLQKHCCLYKTQGLAGDIIQGLPFYQLRAGT